MSGENDFPEGDLYAVLGAQPGESEGELKKKYRKLCLQHHPDKGGDRALAAAINAAWDWLGDPKKRKEYDAEMSRLQQQEEDDTCWGAGTTTTTTTYTETFTSGAGSGRRGGRKRGGKHKHQAYTSCTVSSSENQPSGGTSVLGGLLALNEQLSRNEITRAEFEERKAALMGAADTATCGAGNSEKASQQHLNAILSELREENAQLRQESARMRAECERAQNEWSLTQNQLSNTCRQRDDALAQVRKLQAKMDSMAAAGQQCSSPPSPPLPPLPAPPTAQSTLPVHASAAQQDVPAEAELVQTASVQEFLSGIQDGPETGSLQAPVVAAAVAQTQEESTSASGDGQGSAFSADGTDVNDKDSSCVPRLTDPQEYLDGTTALHHLQAAPVVADPQEPGDVTSSSSSNVEQGKAARRPEQPIYKPPSFSAAVTASLVTKHEGNQGQITCPWVDQAQSQSGHCVEEPRTQARGNGSSLGYEDERRVDPSDPNRKSYSYAEFVEFYQKDADEAWKQAGFYQENCAGARARAEPCSFHVGAKAAPQENQQKQSRGGSGRNRRRRAGKGGQSR